MDEINSTLDRNIKKLIDDINKDAYITKYPSYNNDSYTTDVSNTQASIIDDIRAYINIISPTLNIDRALIKKAFNSYFKSINDIELLQSSIASHANEYSEGKLNIINSLIEKIKLDLEKSIAGIEELLPLIDNNANRIDYNSILRINQAKTLLEVIQLKSNRNLIDVIPNTQEIVAILRGDLANATINNENDIDNFYIQQINSGELDVATAVIEINFNIRNSNNRNNINLNNQTPTNRNNRNNLSYGYENFSQTPYFSGYAINSRSSSLSGPRVEDLDDDLPHTTTHFPDFSIDNIYNNNYGSSSSSNNIRNYSANNNLSDSFYEACRLPNTTPLIVTDFLKKGKITNTQLKKITQVFSVNIEQSSDQDDFKTIIRDFLIRAYEAGMINNSSSKSEMSRNLNNIFDYIAFEFNNPDEDENNPINDEARKFINENHIDAIVIKNQIYKNLLTEFKKNKFHLRNFKTEDYCKLYPEAVKSIMKERSPKEMTNTHVDEASVMFSNLEVSESASNHGSNNTASSSNSGTFGRSNDIRGMLNRIRDTKGKSTKLQSTNK